MVLGFVVLGAAWWLLQAREQGPAAIDPDAPLSTREPELAPSLAGRSVAAGPATTRAFRHALGGTVVNQGGAPVPGCTVLVRAQQRATPRTGPGAAAKAQWERIEAYLDEVETGNVAELELLATLTTDDDGRFQGMSPVRPVQVEARPGSPYLPRLGGFVLDPPPAANDDMRLVVSEGVKLTGRVVDSAGAPLVARVRASTYFWRDDVMSGEDGVFRFPGVPRDVLELRVRFAGREVRGFRIETPGEGEVVLVVPVGEARVEGRVTGPAGEPIQGARVVLDVSVEGAPARTVHVSTRTDATGGFTLEQLPPSSVRALRLGHDAYLPYVLAPGRGDEPAVSIDDARTTAFDVRMRRGSTVRGRVTWADDGTPAVGAAVRLVPEGSAAADPATAITDADGRFELVNLEALRGLLLATHVQGYMAEVEAVLTSRAVGKVAPPEHLTVVTEQDDHVVERDLKLVRGRRISGRVVDGAGAPLAGAALTLDHTDAGEALLTWRGRGGEPEPETVSAEDGSFALCGVAPRVDHRLRATAAGRAEARVGPLDTTSEDLQGVNVVLWSGASIIGHVLDVDGTPVSDATLHIRGVATGNRSIAIGDGGAFEVRGLPADSYALQAERGARSPLTWVLDLGPEEVRAGIDVAFVPTVLVAGVAVDARGAPAAELELSLTPADPQAGRRALRTRTDSAGRFAFEGVLPGVHYLNAPVGSAPHRVVAPDEDVRFVFDPPPSTRVQGVIHDPLGQPVAGAELRLTGADGVRHTLMLGSATFDTTVQLHLPLHLMVQNATSSAGFVAAAPYELVLTESREGLVIRLESGGSVGGRVQDPSGRGLGGVSVLVEGARAVTTDAEGRWTARGVGSGPRFVTWMPPLPWSAPAPRVVEAGESGVDVTVYTGTTLYGRVTLPGDATPPPCRIKAEWPSRGEAAAGHGRTESGADGRFALAGLPADADVDVVVIPRVVTGQPAVHATAVARRVPARTSDLVIQLQVATELSGRVLDERGRPVPGVVIQATGDAQQTLWAPASDASGAFRVPGAAPGSWQLGVSGDEGRGLAPVGVKAPSRDARVIVPRPGRVEGRIEGLTSDDQAVVTCFRARSDGSLAWVMEVDCEADGSFRLDGLPSDAAWTLVARAETGRPRWARRAEVPTGADDVTLHLEAGAAISGRALWEGRAHRHAVVRVVGSAWSSEARTAADGSFTSGALPEGTYRVEVESTTPAPAASRARDAVPAGTSGLEIDLAR